MTLREETWAVTIGDFLSFSSNRTNGCRLDYFPAISENSASA